MWELKQRFFHIVPAAELESLIARERDVARRTTRERTSGDQGTSQEGRRWKSGFERFLEPHAARLFIALREGGVAATGKKLGAKSVDSYLKRRSRGFDPYSVDREPIDRNFWTSKGINWRNSWVEGGEESCVLVLVDAEVYFRAFPLRTANRNSKSLKSGTDFSCRTPMAPPSKLRFRFEGALPFPGTALRGDRQTCQRR